MARFQRARRFGVFFGLLIGAWSVVWALLIVTAWVLSVIGVTDNWHDELEQGITALVVASAGVGGWKMSCNGG